jgi:hypothetical protein
MRRLYSIEARVGALNDHRIADLMRIPPNRSDRCRRRPGSGGSA